MSYKITRSVVHNTNHNMQKFVDWILYDVSFVNDITPLYPTLTENDYYTVINEFSFLIEPLSSWENFFTDTSGFVSYSYSFNGIPQYLGVTDYEQEFLFTDQESYNAWQLQENTKGNNRISGWKASLEEMSINYSNVSIEGNQMINADTGETSEMSVINYLRTKYFTLRGTQVSIIHSIV